MKRIKSLFILAVAALALFGCKEPDPTPVVTDPQAPVIANAKLTGLDGEMKVKAGKPVKFVADVTVEGSELDIYTIEVKKGDDVIASAGGVLEGKSGKIDETLELDINVATLEEEFVPSVYVKVTNIDEMYGEKTLGAGEVATICPPQFFAQMYLVDNNGVVLDMDEMAGQKGRYRTHVPVEDLALLGDVITISEKVSADNHPEGESCEFDTPTSEYGLRYIGFDAISGELFWMIDHTVVFDRTKMDKDCNKYNVFWCMELIPNCEVKFVNYADGMLLQSDRFADVEENSARYIGHYGDKFEVYYIYDETANWLTIKGQYNDNSVVWVTGEGASAPMEPYCAGHPINWFDGNPACAYSALSLQNYKGNTFSVLMYMTPGFGIKLYDYWAWANELSWTSATPGTLVISDMVEDPETGKVDGNYGNAGPDFTEGLWMLSYNKLTKEASLEKYTGRIAAPVKGVEYKPEVPVDDPDEGAALYLVDNGGNAWAMSVASGTKYITDNSTAGVGSSFVFAEKITSENAIDWSGKVYGMKNGVIDVIAEGGDYIPLDAAYGVYNKYPWMIYFDTAAKEVTYKEGLWKSGMRDNGNGELVIWVQTLPHNAEVWFFDFDKPVSEMVNLAVFDNIDNTKGCARYIGVSENYETYYRPEQGWLILSNNICAKQKLLIGKNASFGQAPYTDYPIIETDIPRISGQTLPLNRVSENLYSAYIYMADNASFQLYTAYSWGALNREWTSATPGIVTREDFYAKLGADFYPGVYQITYNEADNTFTLVAKSAKPQAGPLTTLNMVNNAGQSFPMTVVSGTHFITGDFPTTGDSFYFAEKLTDGGAIDWSGRVYGMANGKIAQIAEGGDPIPVDAAYAVYNKHPWKVGFDADALEVVYREGFWKSGMGDNGNGELVIWVQTLPHNCEVFFFDFGKKVSEMVNLAIFDNIDDNAGSARYIGVSENYETYYRPEQGWLILSNNICAKQKLLIGKNASFGQAPYTEYPIIETDIPRISGQTLPLNRLTDDTYVAYIYMADNSSFQLYTAYSWGALNREWTSATPGIVTREDFYAKLGADFVPGLYKISYNETANSFTLEAK